MFTSEGFLAVENPLSPFGKEDEFKSKPNDILLPLKLEGTLDPMPPVNIHDYTSKSNPVSAITSESSQLTSTDEYPSILESVKTLKSKPQHLKGTRCSIPNVKKFIVSDVSDFRSVVERLTGKGAKDIDGKSYQHMLEKEIRERKAHEDMLRCVSSLKMDKTVYVSQECLNCLVYCNLFPKDYEIDRDTLTQLWMAEGLIMEEPMEDIAASYIRALCKHGEHMSFINEDYGTGKLWYKVNVLELPEEVLKSSKITNVKRLSDDPTKTKHTSNFLQHLPTKDLEEHVKLTKLSSLLLSRKHKSNIQQVPFDLFMSMKNLRALDLSRTKVSELPSSIGNVKNLHFLDLSETLVRRLPETLELLQFLQTLKLRNCPRLVALPKAIRRLTTLRHLEIGTLHKLCSMPVGMRNLTCLRTLSEFIVGRQFECHIGELQKMNKLGGKLRLSKLENVASLDDARKANLSHKQQLKKLELHWTDEDLQQENIKVNHKVIEYLQPHTNLEDLRILCYGGSRFPSWLNHPSFVKLTRITLFKCANCLFLPSLGQLPSLKSLSLLELTQVRYINFLFRRDETVAADDNENDQLEASPAVIDQSVAFPALQQLHIKSLLNLEKWSDVEKQDFPCLRNLSIKDCPKLAALCKMQNIRCLDFLELNLCPKLPSLQESELPASLQTLVIDKCPEFDLNSSMVELQDWVKIQDSPGLIIYQRKDEDESLGPALSSSRSAEPPTASSEV